MDKKKKRIVYIILGILITLGIIAGLVVAYYRMYPNEYGLLLARLEGDHSQRLSNDLTLNQNAELMDFYHLSATRDITKLDEYDKFAFKFTDETAEIGDLWSYFVYSFHVHPEEQVAVIVEYRDKYLPYCESSPSRISEYFIVGEPVAAYYMYKYMPEELLVKINWRYDGLNLMQYISYGLFYQVGLSQLENPMVYDGSTPLAGDEATEQFIGAFNAYVWDSQIIEEYALEMNTSEITESDREAAEKTLNEYGFDKQNPITAEWVEKNPGLAYSLLDDLSGPNIFYLNYASCYLANTLEDDLYNVKYMQFYYKNSLETEIANKPGSYSGNSVLTKEEQERKAAQDVER